MDVVILIILAFQIHKKALQFGENPWSWVTRLVLHFLSAEILVGLLILSYFGFDKITYAMIPALFTGLLAGYFVFWQLENANRNKQDQKEEIKEERPNLDHFR